MSARTVPALLVTHGPLGEALISAAESILGPISATEALSNRGLSRDSLIAALGERFARWGEEGGVVLVALMGGSCAQAALAAARAAAPGPVAIVCGVNLPMLLDYATQRDGIEPRDLAARLVERGRAAVLEVPVSARARAPGSAA